MNIEGNGRKCTWQRKLADGYATRCTQNNMISTGQTMCTRTPSATSCTPVLKGIVSCMKHEQCRSIVSRQRRSTRIRFANCHELNRYPVTQEATSNESIVIKVILELSILSPRFDSY